MKTPLLMLILACGINLSYSDEKAGPQQEIVITEEITKSVNNMSNPIIIDSKEIDSIDQLEKYIDEYINKNHEGWSRSVMALEEGKNKYILHCGIRNEDGKVVALSFDVTSVFDRLLKSSDKAVREEINKFLSEFKTSSSETSH